MSVRIWTGYAVQVEVPHPTDIRESEVKNEFCSLLWSGYMSLGLVKMSRIAELLGQTPSPTGAYT